MANNNENKFEYTYSSPGRRTKTSVEARGKFDRPALVCIILGTISCLVFGLGLTCVLEWGNYVVGIVCGAMGIAGMSVGPGLYNRMQNKMSKDDTH